MSNEKPRKPRNRFLFLVLKTFSMEIIVTTFINPFSFFCRTENDDIGDINFVETDCNENVHISNKVSDFNHGQYVAVMWKERWVRGIVTMENQFLIWLVDYGIHLRPNDKTIFIDLPAEYKKYPTKVFEASIHGVSPLDKELTYDGQIINQLSTTWNKGAIDKAKELIASALKKYFVPIGILSTKYNDIVLGDLYLEIAEKGTVNIVDELRSWPIFLEKNTEDYIKKLPTHYTSRRKHRASVLKPEFPRNIPTIYLDVSMTEYNSICANAPPFEQTKEYDCTSEDGSTVVSTANLKRNYDEYKLTPDEIEKYSRMYVTVYGEEYNVLNILLNKLRDLRMCEKYKDYDKKGLGRANSRRRLPIDDEV